jgi:CubicO group peptidase (beta-lactamase class C family)
MELRGLAWPWVSLAVLAASSSLLIGGVSPSAHARPSAMPGGVVTPPSEARLPSLEPRDAGLIRDFPEPDAGAPPPEELAVEASLGFAAIDVLVVRAIHEGKTPGAVVIVGRRDGVLFRRAYGQRSIVPARVEMTADTIFDLASLTKPLVTGALAIWLVDRGSIQLSDPVSKYIPEFHGQGRETVTVQQLLLHTAGLPPTNSLRDYREGPARARARVLGSWLEAYPGKRFIYSDVGYIILGTLIERVTGESLDRTAARVLWHPLGMLDTQYCPQPCGSPRIAPTELASGRHSSPIRGEVQDPRAYWLGGVAGNAGLFSTADDLSRFARMLLGAGEFAGQRVLSPEAVRAYTEPRPVPGGVRALGWDVATPYSTARGRELSERAYGHGGYTGTSLWIDPKLDLFVVFLSNRNHPFGTGNVLRLEGAIADVAVRTLERRVAVGVVPAALGQLPVEALPPALRRDGI